MNEGPGRVGIDFTALNQRMQRISGDLLRAREDLQALRCTGASGDGLVVAEISGEAKLLALRIDSSLMDPDDPERCAALVVEAVDEAHRALDEERRQRLDDVARQTHALRAGLPRPTEAD